MRKRMLVGERFGRLVTVSLASPSHSGRQQWVCACDCGSQKVVLSSSLRTGNTRSCGCLQREEFSQRKTTHGYSTRRLGKTPEYLIWQGIIKRCENPREADFPRYGGRGISICAEWRADFTAFLRDVGARPSAAHSIDRIDVNGNYEPGNCRWASAKQQQNNRRNNRVIDFRGSRLTLTQLSELSVVALPTLRKRLDRGWSAEDAIRLPASPISPRPLSRKQPSDRTLP